MLITKELALKIESCIKQSHSQYTNKNKEGSILKIGTGSAFFSGEQSFFSQVIGWGFDTEKERFIPQIEAIEDFYRQKKHNKVDIELCPLVGNFVFSELSKRGYLITELNNVSVLDLTCFSSYPTATHEKHIVQPIDDNHLGAWARCVALGFEYEEAIDQFYLYAKTEGVTPFGVYIDNELVAGGTIAIHDGICDLGITSTLLTWRGQGLQKALLSKRLEYAKNLGASIASVTTEPGSISDLNIQKMGFQIAYTRIKLRLLLSK